jgi:DNA-binding IclR family transcriptional regulator
MADSSATDRRSTVEKATKILAELAGAATPLTLSELARRTNLAKTTTHRLLSELLADGLVRRCETRYRLDSGVSWLAAPIDERVYRLRQLRSWLLPHLIDLYEETRQTVNLAVVRFDEVIYVERIYGHNRVASRSDGTDRAPAHLTAAGKLLLAYQPDRHNYSTKPVPRTSGAEHDLETELSGIRRQGVAFSFADLTPGVHCAAAPVRDHRGRPIAAVALAGSALEFDALQAIPLLRRTAHAMSLVARRPVRSRASRRTL